MSIKNTHKNEVTPSPILLKEIMTEEQKKILREGLTNSEVVEDIGDRMDQEIEEVTNG